MEIIKIQSSHSLVTSITNDRIAGEHTYSVNCHQYLSSYRSWQRQNGVQSKALGVMTLGYERIWVTEAESKQIADAIQSSHSPFKLD